MALDSESENVPSTSVGTRDVSDTSTGTSDDPAVESPGTDGSADSGDDWAEPGGAVTRSDDKPHATSGGS